MGAVAGVGLQRTGDYEPMSVWYCIPSKRPPEEAEPILKKWRERGYKIALWCDTVAEALAKKHTIAFAPNVGNPYPGYACAVNNLIRIVMAGNPDAEWLVTGGDDIEPDANHSAEEIATQCSEHFAWLHMGPASKNLTVKALQDSLYGLVMRTFGVMQPTGDRYGDNERHMGKPGSAYIDRVAGSPWMGREFCRRMYQGRGPLFEGYFHMGEDEELQAVATKLGVFWQRRDLIHFHHHWARKRQDAADRPAFLERANSHEEWLKYKKLFAERAAAGFPGHEPLEV
jgi:hypothetical protein